MPLGEDGIPRAYPTFAERHLVRIDGAHQFSLGDALAPTPSSLPDDFCLPLVELGAEERVIECSEISARWCPICGDCTCTDDMDLNDDDCPLHSGESLHGTRRVVD